MSSAPKNVPASPTRPWRARSICLLLSIAVLLVFWPVVGFEFINYDDPDYVSSNTHVQKGVTWENVKWAFAESHASNWHPLTWISHMLDWQFFGNQPGGHHMMNVLLHLGSTLLLFLVLRKMTGAAWPAAFVAALFALHPLHVESVAWVAERKDVLSAFFWILTMLVYAHYVEQAALRSKWRAPLYLLTLVCFALGLMAKPMVVTLPFVLLLLDYWPLNRFGKGAPGAGNAATIPRTPPARVGLSVIIRELPRLALEKIPFFALIAISSALTFWAQKKGGAVTSLHALPVASRVSNAVISYPRYLGKMLWPENLAVLYPHPWKWHLGLALAAGLFLVAATVIVIRQWEKRPYLAVGWFWFLGTLVPVIGLVQVGLQSIADRYTYIPLIGIFMAIAWVAYEFVVRTPAQKRTMVIAASIVLLLCAVKTSMQLRYWKNSGTLFSHAVKVTEKNFLAHNNLGFYLYNNKQQTNAAMTHYEAALRIYPQFEIAWNNMGYALAGLNRFQEAIIHYKQALKLNPKHADVHNNLGNALGTVGQDAEAIEHYMEALKINPNHVDAHNNLGVALSQQGKPDEGMQHLRKSVELNPKYASARSNLGNALAIAGKIDEAIEQYDVALQLKPDDAQAHNNIGNALSAKNRLDEAVEHYRTALKLNANNPEAECNLGFALVKQGKLEEARLHLTQALRLRPNYPEAQRQLDMLNARP